MDIKLRRIEDTPGKSTMYEIVKILGVGQNKNGEYEIGDRKFKIGDKISEKDRDNLKIPGLHIG